MQVHVFLSLAAFIDYNETYSHIQTSPFLDIQFCLSSLLASVLHSMDAWRHQKTIS